MPRLEAKISYSSENREQIKALTIAFFTEFNSKSSICSKSGKCDLVICFEEANPPIEIITKILDANPEEFVYLGEQSEVLETKETEAKSDVSETKAEETETELDVSETEAEEAETKTDVSENVTKVSKAETKKVPQKPDEDNSSIKGRKKRGRTIKECDIHLLDELASKSNSYEEMIDLLANTIDFGKRKNIFVEYMNEASKQKNEINYQAIFGILISKGYKVTEWDKIEIGQRVSKYFKTQGQQITFTVFVNALLKYKNYFKNEEESISNTDIGMSRVKTENMPEIPDFNDFLDKKISSEKSDCPVEANKSSGTSRVKMKCMPEIPEFEKFLGSLDKRLPLDYRVEKLITYMSSDQNMVQYVFRQIQEYILTSIKIKEVEHEKIMKENKKLDGSSRLYLTRMVNEFVKSKHSYGVMVAREEFLEEIHKILL